MTLRLDKNLTHPTPLSSTHRRSWILWDAHRGGGTVSHMEPLSIIPKVLSFRATNDIFKPPTGPAAAAEQSAFRAFTSGLDLKQDGMWYLVEFKAGKMELCVGAGFAQTFVPAGSNAQKELGRYRPEYSFIR
jgi:hypothetical protein